MDCLGRLGDMELYYKHCERPAIKRGDSVRVVVGNALSFIGQVARLSGRAIVVTDNHGKTWIITQAQVEEVLDATNG